MKTITILIPAYNESANLRNLLNELNRLVSSDYAVQIKDEVRKENVDSTVISMKDYRWEFLFVNDGSKDDTLELLRQLRQEDSRVNIVNLSRNFGKENALLAGMDYATGDALVIMDADLQDPVSVVPEMIYWWEHGYEDVYGTRSDRGKESWMRKRLSLAFYAILQKMTRIEILPNTGDFRLLDKRVVKAIISLRETQRYTKGLYSWVGFNKKQVLFKRHDRVGGKSSFNLLSLFNLAIEGITCFTTAPLRVSSCIGLIASSGALLYMIYTLVKTLMGGPGSRISYANLRNLVFQRCATFGSGYYRGVYRTHIQ